MKNKKSISRIKRKRKVRNTKRISGLLMCGLLLTSAVLPTAAVLADKVNDVAVESSVTDDSTTNIDEVKDLATLPSNTVTEQTKETEQGTDSSTTAVESAPVVSTEQATEVDKSEKSEGITETTTEQIKEVSVQSETSGKSLEDASEKELVTFKVRYVDESGKDISYRIYTGQVGEKFKVNFDPMTHRDYKLKEGEKESIDIEISKGIADVVFHYVKVKKSTVKIEFSNNEGYIDQSKTVSYTGVPEEKISLKDMFQPWDTHYDFVNLKWIDPESKGKDIFNNKRNIVHVDDNVPDSLEKGGYSIPDNDVTFKVIYHGATVHPTLTFVDEKGNKLGEDWGAAYVGEQVSLSKVFEKKFIGAELYTYVKSDSPELFKVENKQYDITITLKKVKKISSTITLDFVDDKGNKISDSVTYRGSAGSKLLKNFPNSFNGYIYLSDNLPVDDTIENGSYNVTEFKEKDQHFIVKYIKEPVVLPQAEVTNPSTITIRYLDKSGKEIGRKDFTANVGEHLITGTADGLQMEDYALRTYAPKGWGIVTSSFIPDGVSEGWDGHGFAYLVFKNQPRIVNLYGEVTNQQTPPDLSFNPGGPDFMFPTDKSDFHKITIKYIDESGKEIHKSRILEGYGGTEEKEENFGTGGGRIQGVSYEDVLYDADSIAGYTRIKDDLKNDQFQGTIEQLPFVTFKPKDQVINIYYEKGESEKSPIKKGTITHVIRDIDGRIIKKKVFEGEIGSKLSVQVVKDYIAKALDELEAEGYVDLNHYGRGWAGGLSVDTRFMEDGEYSFRFSSQPKELISVGPAYVQLIDSSMTPEESTNIITDETTGINISADEKVIPKGTRLSVEQINSGTEFDSLKQKFNDFRLFDISLLDGNNSKIEPNGKVVVSLPIPSALAGKNLRVYHIDGDNHTLMPGRIIGNMYVFETTHFSHYALVEGKEDVDPTPDDGKDSSTNDGEGVKEDPTPSKDDSQTNTDSAKGSGTNTNNTNSSKGNKSTKSSQASLLKTGDSSNTLLSFAGAGVLLSASLLWFVKRKRN